MNRRSERQPSLQEAKANFAASVGAVDPMRAVKEHALLAVGASALLGMLMSRSGMKLARKAFWQPSLAYMLLKKFLF